MNAGKLRFSADVYIAPAADVLGNTKQKQTLYDYSRSFRCNLVSTGSQEVEYGNGISTLQTFVVLCRWESVKTLDLKNRLVINNRTLNITGINNPDQLGIDALISCVEVTI